MKTAHRTGKISANHILDKGLNNNIYKELIHLNSKKKKSYLEIDL